MDTGPSSQKYRERVSIEVLRLAGFLSVYRLREVVCTMAAVFCAGFCTPLNTAVLFGETFWH